MACGEPLPVANESSSVEDDDEEATDSNSETSDSQSKFDQVEENDVSQEEDEADAPPRRSSRTVRFTSRYKEAAAAQALDLGSDFFVRRRSAEIV
jgi:hypothetical protein